MTGQYRIVVITPSSDGGAAENASTAGSLQLIRAAAEHAAHIHAGAEIVALRVGAPALDSRWRDVFAAGADRAVRLNTDALPGEDVVVLEHAVASVVASFDPNLVLVGAHALGHETAFPGYELASALGLPVVGGVVEVLPAPSAELHRFVVWEEQGDRTTVEVKSAVVCLLHDSFAGGVNPADVAQDSVDLNHAGQVEDFNIADILDVQALVAAVNERYGALEDIETAPRNRLKKKRWVSGLKGKDADTRLAALLAARSGRAALLKRGTQWITDDPETQAGEIVDFLAARNLL